MKAKEYEDVTLNDVIGVMTDKEKEELYLRAGMMSDTIKNRMKDMDAVIWLGNTIKEITGTNDLKLLYYGRTLLGEIELGEE